MKTSRRIFLRRITCNAAGEGCVCVCVRAGPAGGGGGDRTPGGQLALQFLIVKSP